MNIIEELQKDLRLAEAANLPYVSVERNKFAMLIKELIDVERRVSFLEQLTSRVSREKYADHEMGG